MEIAKVFKSGNSQAVLLPKEYRFNGDEVGIKKVGRAIVLFPKDHACEVFLEGINGFTEDFMSSGRAEQFSQDRDLISRNVCKKRECINKTTSIV